MNERQEEQETSLQLPVMNFQFNSRHNNFKWKSSIKNRALASDQRRRRNCIDSTIVWLLYKLLMNDLIM